MTTSETNVRGLLTPDVAALLDALVSEYEAAIEQDTTVATIALESTLGRRREGRLGEAVRRNSDHSALAAAASATAMATRNSAAVMGLQRAITALLNPDHEHARRRGALCRDDGTGSCAVCKVTLEECPDCKGIAYHQPGCSASESPRHVED